MAEQKLSKEILKNLMLGVFSIRLAEQTDVLTDTTFDNSDEIYTTEGTLNVDQADPSVNELRIDQSDVPIDTSYTAGEYKITGTLPSSAKPVFDYFYEKSSEQPTLTNGITSADGTTKYKKAYGYEIQSKRKKATIMIENQAKDRAIVLMNVDLIASTKWGDVKTSPLGIGISGTVLSNNTKGQPSFVILENGETV